MRIAVYGATGHTAGSVLGELVRRGHAPVAIARDEAKLARVATHAGIVERRVARLDAAHALDRALAGCAAVIHCAGPFLDTAEPLVDAALRTRVDYFDLTAEKGSARATFERFAAPARERGIAIVPAAGFLRRTRRPRGGSRNLRPSRADRIDIAVALEGWWPTDGTRRTGERNTVPRVIFANGRFEPLSSPAERTWEFPEPFGRQDVLEVPLTETILIARHLPVREIRNFINLTPLRELSDAATPSPVAVDDRGRSNQRFLIDVRARDGDAEHPVTVAGQDIYAVTAPLVVEAVERIAAASAHRAGAFALAELVDARAFLAALAERGDLVIA